MGFGFNKIVEALTGGVKRGAEETRKPKPSADPIDWVNEEEFKPARRGWNVNSQGTFIRLAFLRIRMSDMERPEYVTINDVRFRVHIHKSGLFIGLSTVRRLEPGFLIRCRIGSQQLNCKLVKAGAR